MPIEFYIGTKPEHGYMIYEDSLVTIKITKSKGIEIKMKTRQERKQEIKRFFDRLNPEELDKLLERNGINDKESKEALVYRNIKEGIEKGEM